MLSGHLFRNICVASLLYFMLAGEKASSLSVKCHGQVYLCDEINEQDWDAKCVMTKTPSETFAYYKCSEHSQGCRLTFTSQECDCGNAWYRITDNQDQSRLECRTWLSNRKSQTVLPSLPLKSPSVLTSTAAALSPLHALSSPSVTICAAKSALVPSPARVSTTSSFRTVLSAAISSTTVPSFILKEEEATFTSNPASSLDTADAAFIPKYSSSTVSKATTLTPTSSSSLASLLALSPTTLSSVVSLASKLLPKPSLTPVSSSPELLSTIQPSMVLSEARSLSKVSTAAALPSTFPTESATARSSPTTQSSITFSAEMLSKKSSSLIVSLSTILSITSPPLNISVQRSSTPPSSVLKSASSSPIPSCSSTPSSTSSSGLIEMQKLANDSVSKLSSLNVTRNNSLQEAASAFRNFTIKYRNITLGKNQPGVNEFKTGSIFRVAVAFEKFALRYGKYHLSGTRRSIRIDLRNMFLAIHNGYRQNTSDFYLEEQEWQASINISSRNFPDNGSVVVGCVYKDLHDLLQAKSDKIRHVQTRIIMAAMDPKPVKLQENIILTFKNLKNDPREKHCMFWSGLSKSQDGFSKDGCHVVTSRSNLKETVCSCNHLTHFAVLVDYSGDSVLSQNDEDILEIITYIGLSLSIIGMILTVIIYSLFTDVHKPLTQIRLSLAASLGAGQISFLAGMHAMDNPTICITAAVFTQYFLMAAFCWMLVEGIYFYLFIVKVYNISNRLIVYHVVAWGFPVIMISTSLSIAIGKGGIQSYTSNKSCWLSSTYDLIWIFVAFLTATGVLGSFILARVIRELTTLPQTGANKIQRVRLGIRTCLLMIPLLGITWLFGLLSPLHKAFTYIFTILNSTQGVLIFILHCMRNSQIRERLRGKIKTVTIGQIRARMKARMNAVSPSPNNRNSTKKNVKTNPTDGGAVWATKLHPFSEYELK